MWPAHISITGGEVLEAIRPAVSDHLLGRAEYDICGGSVIWCKGRYRQFDEIQVHRIDVVEPDGTLRMVISNKDRLPPVIVKGREHPEFGEPRPQAGMLFYNAR